MPSVRLIRTPLVLVVAGLSALLVRAAVYQTGGAAEGDIFNPSSFGRCIYQTVMRINGGRADVSVVSCEGRVGSRQATRDGKTMSLLALTPSAESRTLIIAVAQSEREQKASRPDAVRHQIEGIPVPAGATILSYQGNEDTRTSLERVSVRMQADGVRDYYDARMAGSGWARLFPAVRDSGLQIYTKGADLCCIGVGETDSYGESKVTLLHKRGAVK